MRFQFEFLALLFARDYWGLNMFIMRILFLGGALALPSPLLAEGDGSPDEQSRVVPEWDEVGSLYFLLDQHYSEIASGCIGQPVRRRKLREREVPGSGEKRKTFIPNEILEWDFFRDYFNRSPISYENSIFHEAFRNVYLEENGGSLSVIGPRIGSPWTVNDRPAIDSLVDLQTSRENCLTLFDVNGDINANAGLFRAAAEGSLNSNRAVRSFAIAGSVRSPFAIAVGALDAPNGYSLPRHQNHYLLTLWDWYKDNPEEASRPLKLDGDLLMVAIVRNRSLTQDTLLNATASLAFGFGSYETEGSLEALVGNESADYETAILERFTPIDFPQADEIKESLEETSLILSNENPRAMDGEAVVFAASLPNWRQSECMGFWSNASVGVGLQTSDLGATWNDEQGSCEFTLTLMPSPGTQDLKLTFKVQSDAISDAVQTRLTFATGQQVFANQTSFISFAPEDRIASNLEVAAEPINDFVDYRLSFRVVEIQGANLSTVLSNTSTIACGNGEAEPVITSTPRIETEGSSRFLRFEARISPTLINEIQTGGFVQCSVGNELVADRGGSLTGEIPIALPTIDFLIQKARRPQPIPSAETLAPATEG